MLIGLSRATIGNKNRPTSETDKIMIEGLFTTITNVSFDDEAIKRQIEKTEVEKVSLYLDVQIVQQLVIEMITMI
ncbi:hypothetical protein ACK2IE_03625 [Clostridioides difficile]